MGLYFQKKDKTASQGLSAGALSYTTDYGRKFKLEKVILRFSQNVTETITITLDSANGANYDVVLRKRTIGAARDFVYEPVGQSNYQVGDEIKIECTNANLVGTVYVTVKASELP